MQSCTSLKRIKKFGKKFTSSKRRYEVSKNKYLAIYARFDANDIVNIGPLTTKFVCFSSTFRLLCRIIQLR